MPPPYTAVITSPAARDLNSIPERVLPAILAFIFGPLQDNPHRVGAGLGHTLAGSHSARRGGYRVIYAIDDATVTIYVQRVAARSDVYRPR